MDETIEIKQMKKVFPDNPFVFDLFLKLLRVRILDGF